MSTEIRIGTSRTAPGGGGSGATLSAWAHKGAVNWAGFANYCVWVSATGLYMMIAETGAGSRYIWVSTDSGKTWNRVAALANLAWKVNAVVCSDDGAYMFAGGGFSSTKGYIYRSVDQGANWSQVGGNGTLYPVGGLACSSDGQYVFATFAGAVWRSIDYGATFTTTGSIYAGGSICCSGSGQYVYYSRGATYPYIYRSTAYGASGSWSYVTCGAVVDARINCSDDGSIVNAILAGAIIGDDSTMKISTDFGASYGGAVALPHIFSTATMMPSCDHSGTRLIYVADGAIHLSEDSGATWTHVGDAGGSYATVAMSGDYQCGLAAESAAPPYVASAGGPPPPCFAVSRDSAGILLAVRDNAAPQFTVARDSGGLSIMVP